MKALKIVGFIILAFFVSRELGNAYQQIGWDVIFVILPFVLIIITIKYFRNKNKRNTLLPNKIKDPALRKKLEEFQKLPKPTNESLNALLIDIDKIVFKHGGVYEGRATSDHIVLTISQQANIQQFKALLEIIEPTESNHCMCLGTYAIELFSRDQLKATIGFHHGDSIRYNKWYGDADLAKPNELLEFLSQQGLTDPLQDKMKTEQQLK
jgi:hypothetical protein